MLSNYGNPSYSGCVNRLDSPMDTKQNIEISSVYCSVKIIIYILKIMVKFSHSPAIS